MVEPQHDSILDAVKAEMQRRGWSANELAKQSGAARPSITRWFAGERSISLPVLRQILDAMGLELVVRKRRAK